MSNSKYQHYVPQTYLKKWLNSNNQLFLYGKDNQVKKVCKTDRILGKTNFYVKDDLVIFSEEQKRKKFSCLEGFIVICEGKKLKTLDELAKNYFLFDEWIIKNSDNDVCSKKKFKSEIEKVKILDIDDLLGKIETEWNEIYEVIKGLVENPEEKNIDQRILKKVKKIAIIQEYRNPKKINELEKLMEIKLGFLKDEMKECYDIMKNEFPKPLFLKNLENLLDGNPKGVYKERYNAFEKSSLKIMKATGNEKYLTNDNPINFLKYKNEFEIIYFVLSPDILCFFILDEKEKFKIEQMPMNDIRKFNKKIRKDAIEFYISSNKIKFSNK